MPPKTSVKLDHSYCAAPQSVDECEHITVNRVVTFSTAEDSTVSEGDSASVEKVKVANGCKDNHVYQEADWDGISGSLRIGLTFQTRRQVREFLAIYGSKSLCKMVVASGGASDTSKTREVCIVSVIHLNLYFYYHISILDKVCLLLWTR